METAAVSRRKPLLGSERPRLYPPTPARHELDRFVEVAERDCGITLFPWQRTAARYVTARGAGDRWLYRHVAIVVARQNGKTRLLVPLIVDRLKRGHRIMHTAQDRNLPREVFSEVAEIMGADPDSLPRKNGRVVMPRFANGQEEIKTRNGGVYSLVAPTRGGARGPSRDLVIIDELREMDTTDFLAAAGPTLQASKSPQMLYLSNAGDDSSVVLNSLKASATTDPSLAYLEWSAAPERLIDDFEGWREANPSIGHIESIVENLRMDYETHKARGTLAIFETENLCRWVPTLRERLVDDKDWTACAGTVGRPVRPSLAVSVAPDGSRGTIAMAWRRSDDKIALEVVADVRGDPVDTDALGVQLRDLAVRHSSMVGLDPDGLDAELTKYVKKTRTVILSGNKYAAASAQFGLLVSAGRLVHENAGVVGDDLTWTVRKQDSDGSFMAVRADDRRSITSSLAAIRAVWLASGPAVPTARVL